MLNRENKLDYYLKIGLITLFVGFFLTHLSPKMAIRTEFTFFTLDVYHAIMMKIEPTDRLYTPSDNPYIHLKNYQLTYHDAKPGYTEVFQVRRVGFMYFCVGGVTGP